MTTTSCAYGRIFDAISIAPILASSITIGSTDFHKEHIVHVTTKTGVSFSNFWCGLIARTTSGVEEVDEDTLATIENVEQMDFGTVTIGCRKINSLRMRALRFQTKTENNCC